MRLVTIVAAVVLSAVALTLDIPGQKDASANVPTPPSARTGAPGETQCGSCHAGNSGNQTVTLTAVPPVTEYIPGNSYNIALGIDDPGMIRWGFEATALKDSDNSMAGTFTTLVDTHVTTLSAGGRTYVCHTTNGAVAPGNPTDGTWWGTPDGPVAWLFTWTAPPQGSGDVTFYAATVSADGNNSDTGDNTYTVNMTLTEASTVPVTSTTWGKIKNRYK